MFSSGSTRLQLAASVCVDGEGLRNGGVVGDLKYGGVHRIFPLGFALFFLFCCLGFFVPMTSFAFVRRLYRVGLESDNSERTINVPDTVFAREDTYTWW
jgi:hypothetical protein